LLSCYNAINTISSVENEVNFPQG